MLLYVFFILFSVYLSQSVFIVPTCLFCVLLILFDYFVVCYCVEFLLVVLMAFIIDIQRSN
jgi:hypothetical protein